MQSYSAILPAIWRDRSHQNNSAGDAGREMFAAIAPMRNFWKIGLYKSVAHKLLCRRSIGGDGGRRRCRRRPIAGRRRLPHNAKRLTSPRQRPPTARCRFARDAGMVDPPATRVQYTSHLAGSWRHRANRLAVRKLTAQTIA